MVEEKKKGRGFRKNGKPTSHFPTNIVIEDECGEITTDMQVCIIVALDKLSNIKTYMYNVLV